ncbi:MAG: hypothetical protein HC829_09190 [Bacteroidales bacterium]|nr:hypothetical protein [Bacteroidales bacterium]
MDEAAVRESRKILRRVQEHLHHAHAGLGARQETVGLVDVLYHPTSTLSSLNYVTPRRSTAWVPSEMINQGLEHLRKLERTPRVQYIEGLFPPLFSKTLFDLGLEADCPLPEARQLGIEFTPENVSLFSADVFNRYLVTLYEYLQVH